MAQHRIGSTMKPGERWPGWGIAQRSHGRCAIAAKLGASFSTPNFLPIFYRNGWTERLKADLLDASNQVDSTPGHMKTPFVILGP